MKILTVAVVLVFVAQAASREDTVTVKGTSRIKMDQLTKLKIEMDDLGRSVRKMADDALDRAAVKRISETLPLLKKFGASVNDGRSKELEMDVEELNFLAVDLIERLARKGAVMKSLDQANEALELAMEIKDEFQKILKPEELQELEEVFGRLKAMSDDLNAFFRSTDIPSQAADVTTTAMTLIQGLAKAVKDSKTPKELGENIEKLTEGLIAIQQVVNWLSTKVVGQTIINALDSGR